MGFEGATPLAVLFPHFLSEKKMGCPSRHERQMKRILRGKSQAGKGKSKKIKDRTRAQASRTRRANRQRTQKSAHPLRFQKRTRGSTEQTRKPGQKEATAAGGARTASLPYGAARRTKRTPPNRQNLRSLFCLPGGGLVYRAAKNLLRCFWLARPFSASHCAQRRARRCTKGGRRPLLSPAAF